MIVNFIVGPVVVVNCLKVVEGRFVDVGFTDVTEDSNVVVFPEFVVVPLDVVKIIVNLIVGPVVVVNCLKVVEGRFVDVGFIVVPAGSNVIVVNPESVGVPPDVAKMIVNFIVGPVVVINCLAVVEGTLAVEEGTLAVLEVVVVIPEFVFVPPNVVKITENFDEPVVAGVVVDCFVVVEVGVNAVVEGSYSIDVFPVSAVVLFVQSPLNLLIESS